MEKGRYVIDRFEEDRAVLCDDTGEMHVLVKQSFLADIADAKEGDVLYFDGDGWSHDQEETQRHQRSLHDRMQGMFRRGQSSK